MADISEKKDDRLSNREAEKSIISCMLQDQDTIISAIEMLDGNEFKSADYRKIFVAIKDLASKNDEPNIVTVRDYLITKGEKGNVVDADYLSDIAIYVANPKQINTFIDIVKEKYIIRKTVEACAQINKECIGSDDDIDDILDRAQGNFFELAKKKGQKEYRELRDVLPEILFNVGEAAKTKDGITGIRTKFEKLDKCTSGFQKGNLIIVAARPSVGKTAFALNLADNIIKGGYNVAFFSLEMKDVELGARILSLEAKFPGERMRSGRVNDNDMQHLLTTSGMLSEDDYAKGKFYIDDSGKISIAELRSKCRKIKKENGLDIVFIDYLQLMHAGDITKGTSYAKFINNRQEEVAEISRSLKGLAKELDIPIVALAQTRRPSDTSDKKDKRPQLEDLKESGAIEQDADIVMFLHRPHKDDQEHGDIEEMQLIVAKNRNGRVPTITLHFDGSITEFREFDKKNDNIMPPSTNKKENNADEEKSAEQQ